MFCRVEGGLLSLFRMRLFSALNRRMFRGTCTRAFVTCCEQRNIHDNASSASFLLFFFNNNYPILFF